MAKSKAKSPSERPSVVAREFIEAARREAKKRGEEFVELVSGDIHKALNWKSRLPLVCDAMKNSMQPGDRVVHTTPSGKSSTITMRYYTADPGEPALESTASDFSTEENEAFAEAFSSMAESRICKTRNQTRCVVMTAVFCVLSVMLGFFAARIIYGSNNN